MDFDHFLEQAWTDHASDPPAVATRLQAEGLPLLTEAGRIAPFAHLAHHVFGEHLGRWADGEQLLRRLAALPACPAEGDTPAALRRHIVSLQLAGGTHDARPGLGASDGVRVTALAAGCLARHDAVRAGALLRDALARHDSAGLPDKDPCTRALAVTGNNLAATLEDEPMRSPAGRELMILAAQTGRRFWALAGTWLETERAEYRLAMTWLQAGDPAQARHHAQQCLAIVAEHGQVALERFFGWEAMALAERAASQAAGHAQALAQAEAAFAALDESDRGWVRASLDRLQVAA